MNAVFDRLSGPVMEAFGWTLLHSLWQFTLVALLLLFALSATRSATKRYVVAYASLLVMVACFAATFTWVYPSDVPSVSQAPRQAIAQPALLETSLAAPSFVRSEAASGDASVVPSDQSSAIADPSPTVATFDVAPARPERSFELPTVPEAWARRFAMGWMCGVALLSLWQLCGWIGILRLRRSATECPSGPIESIARQLIEKMRIKASVRIRQSVRVHAPMVIGWLKPIVLLPIGILAELSPAELESILAHELAHVRRRDYLANLLQTALETVFFYHPAVWWISRRIRLEREHCCDDAAVQACGSRVDLSAALTKAAAARVDARLAVAAAGRPSQALRRVQRLLGAEPQRRELPQASAAAALVLLGLTLALQWDGRVAAEEDASPPEQGDGSAGSYEAPLPRGAVARLGTTRFRLNGGWHNRLAFSRDGKTIVVYTGNRGLSWWNAETGELRKRVKVEQSRWAKFAASADRRLVGVAARGLNAVDGQVKIGETVQVWSIGAAERLGEFPLKEGRQVESIAFTSDGQQIVVGDTTGHIHLGDLATYQWLLELQLNELRRGIQSLAVSPDGQSIAAVANVNLRQNLFLCNLLSGEEPEHLQHFERVTAVAFSPDGQTLAVCQDEMDGRDQLTLWDLARSDVARALQPPVPTLLNAHQVSFSPDGKYIAAANTYRGLRKRYNDVLVWSVESGDLKLRLPPDDAVYPAAVAFSLDQTKFAAVSDHEISVWDFPSGERIASDLVGHTAMLSSVSFTPDDREIVTASDDATARIWDMETGEMVSRFSHEKWIRGMAVSPNGRWVATSSLDDTVRVWQRESGEEVYRLPGHGEQGGKRELAFSEDSARLTSFGDDTYLRVWDMDTGRAVLEAKITPDGVDLADADPFGAPFGGPRFERAVLSRDGSRLLVCTSESMYLYDAATGAELKKFPAKTQLRSVCFTPDGSKLLLARATRQRKGEQLPNGQIRQENSWERDFAMLDIDREAILWSFEIDGAHAPMCVSSDGQLVAVSTRGESEHVVYVLDAATGAQIGAIPQTDLLSWPSNGSKMAFSHDNRRLATCFHNTTALVWQLFDEEREQ
ncbi:MAG: M56 family metallopeptidase [Planctomycetota bacterium]